MAAIAAVLVYVAVREDPGLVLPVGVAAVLALAYANGANDISKAIATLVGAGVADFRRAALWGGMWTGVGAAGGAVAAHALLATFSQGLTAPNVALPPEAALAAVIGGLGWVVLATYGGLPVSTTHAITGALVAVIWWHSGSDGVAWRALGVRIVLPLLVSLLLAAGLTVVTSAIARPLPTWAYPDRLHWLSSGTVALARGLNDAPKLVALTVGLGLADGENGPPTWVFLAVASAMLLGSVLAGWRVTRTLGERVTTLDHRDGLGANLATALLVSIASSFGWPVSTTHVSSAAIAEVGVRRGLAALHGRVLAEMGLAWLITLPAAGLLAVMALLVLRT